MGVDGSDTGLRALDWATDEAGRRRTALRLVFAHGGSPGQRVPSDSPDRPPATSTARHVVAGAAERAERRAPGLPVRTDIRPEEPIDALLEESGRAEVVVIGTPDRSEATDLVLGCTTLTVAGRADCPVVAVRGDRAHRAGTLGRVVLAVADPGCTAGPADFAFAEAALRGCPVLAVRAWRRPRKAVSRNTPPEQAAALERLRAQEAVEEAVRLGTRAHPSVAADTLVREGRALDVVLRGAASGDLLVTGSRRPGLFGLGLGVVPHALLHQAPCPVAVVPHPSP